MKREREGRGRDDGVRNSISTTEKRPFDARRACIVFLLVGFRRCVVYHENIIGFRYFNKLRSVKSDV